uniref:Ig-like domain-containing protein n=1 Tax=Strigamia maritima TaxID=126957 RepID=T1JMP5_STRMM
MYFNIIFLLPLIVVEAQRNPTISYITREQITNIGGVINLECSVQFAQDYPIFWSRIDPSAPRDSLTLSSGSSMMIRDNRFSLRHDTATSTYTLQIKDIQESDAGTYQCQVVITMTNKITADVQVLVRMPPIISDNSTRSVVVSEGQAVRLECYAGGFPPPKIYWRRESNAILPTGGSLHRGSILNIPRVTKEDRGTYYCVADNGVGRGSRRNINVEVEFAPVLTIARPRVGQALLYDADLECHVEAYPPPAITWIKDGFVLTNNQHYQVSIFATADEYTDSTLRAVTVEKKQYGIYICRAANKLGINQANVELFETVVPVCPPACHVSRNQGAISNSLNLAVFATCVFITLVKIVES